MDSKNAAKRSESPAALGGKPQGFSIRDDTKKSSAQRRTEKPVPPTNNDDDFFNSANQGGAAGLSNFDFDFGGSQIPKPEPIKNNSAPKTTEQA